MDQGVRQDVRSQASTCRRILVERSASASEDDADVDLARPIGHRCVRPCRPSSSTGLASRSRRLQARDDDPSLVVEPSKLAEQRCDLVGRSLGACDELLQGSPPGLGRLLRGSRSSRGRFVLRWWLNSLPADLRRRSGPEKAREPRTRGSDAADAQNSAGRATAARSTREAESIGRRQTRAHRPAAARSGARTEHSQDRAPSRGGSTRGSTTGAKQPLRERMGGRSDAKAAERSAGAGRPGTAGRASNSARRREAGEPAGGADRAATQREQPHRRPADRVRAQGDPAQQRWSSRRPSTGIRRAERRTHGRREPRRAGGSTSQRRSGPARHEIDRRTPDADRSRSRTRRGDQRRGARTRDAISERRSASEIVASGRERAHIDGVDMVVAVGLGRERGGSLQRSTAAGMSASPSKARPSSRVARRQRQFDRQQVPWLPRSRSLRRTLEVSRRYASWPGRAAPRPSHVAALAREPGSGLRQVDFRSPKVAKVSLHRADLSQHVGLQSRLLAEHLERPATAGIEQLAGADVAAAQLLRIGDTEQVHDESRAMRWRASTRSGPSARRSPPPRTGRRWPTRPRLPTRRPAGAAHRTCGRDMRGWPAARRPGGPSRQRSRSRRSASTER